MSRSIKSLHPKRAYEYIKNCLESIKPTWYATKLVDKENEVNSIKSMEKYIKSYKKKNELPIIFPNDGRLQITLKNIYNYAKSKCHYIKKDTKKSKFLPYAKYWRSLNSETKKKIKDRINFDAEKNDITKWFNISGYIKKIFELLPDEYSQIQIKTKVLQINILISINRYK